MGTCRLEEGLKDYSHLRRAVNTERVFIVSLVPRKAALTLHRLCRVG